MGIPLARQRLFVAFAVPLVLFVTGAGLSTSAEAAPRTRHHVRHQAACSREAGSATCKALVVTGADAQPQTTSGPSGLSPNTIKSVYDFPTSPTAGAGQTIAIVSAYNAPTAAKDLEVFSQQFGLPSCTVANGCFKKVNQNGGKAYPKTSGGWALETSLDVEWAHAIAPGAKILLVEATTNAMGSLLSSVDYAKTHANYVSMSWGTDEYSKEKAGDKHFVQSGVSFFAASGDDGIPALYPSTSPNVISVGGTKISRALPPYEETGWAGGGGGCSRFETANATQAAFSGYAGTGCAGKRATPDISLDADPNSGVAVYDSTGYHGGKGWFTIGGTSLATPMVAGRAAVTGDLADASTIYGGSIAFRDINVGNNGVACATGYELCTGRGSWTG